ncbi:MAG: hypothetical protein FWF60_04500 [Oscillospiraceae bacterium]|nr:hypothetical protein [Oscillospiraceae bacterium]
MKHTKKLLALLLILALAIGFSAPAMAWRVELPEGEMTFLDYIVWPLTEGFNIASDVIFVSGFLLTPLFPIIFLGGWIYAFFFQFFG